MKPKDQLAPSAKFAIRDAIEAAELGLIKVFGSLPSSIKVKDAPAGIGLATRSMAVPSTLGPDSAIILDVKVTVLPPTPYSKARTVP